MRALVLFIHVNLGYAEAERSASRSSNVPTPPPRTSFVTNSISRLPSATPAKPTGAPSRLRNDEGHRREIHRGEVVLDSPKVLLFEEIVSCAYGAAPNFDEFWVFTFAFRRAN